MMEYKNLFTPREVNYTSPFYWVKHLMEIIVAIPFFGQAIFYLLFLPIFVGISFVIALTLFPDGDFIILISGFIIMLLLYFLAGKLEIIYEYREDKFRNKIFKEYENEIIIYNKFLCDYEIDSRIIDDPVGYFSKVLKELDLSDNNNLAKKLKRLHFNTYRKKESKVNSSHLDILFRNL